jgi:hypothetical protein
MTNIGNYERTLRIFLGAGILSLGYYYSSYWGLLGAIPLGTGFFGICPIYSFLDSNSDKKPRER